MANVGKEPAPSLIRFVGVITRFLNSLGEFANVERQHYERDPKAKPDFKVL